MGYLVEGVLVEVGGELEVVVGEGVLLELGAELCDDLLRDAVVEFLDLVYLSLHC